MSVQRYEGHTPLPWQASLSDPRKPEGDWEVFFGDEDDDERPIEFVAEFLTNADALLIVKSVNGFPSLLEQLTRLNADYAALLAKAEAMAQLLGWALTEMDGNPDVDDLVLPDHACDFVDNPERGKCEFHERYVEAVFALAAYRAQK